MAAGDAPPLTAFTTRERRLIQRLPTPLAVQRFLNALDYNMEPPPGRATLRSFRGVVRHQTAHCLEAALAAAVILEQHGFPPLVLSFESIDQLDHVIFVYRRKGRWGSVARSRDPGPAWAKARLCDPPSAGAELCRPVRRLHRPRDRLCGGRSAHARRLRLAAVRSQRLESRAHAARLSAPGDHGAPTNASTACGDAMSSTGDGSATSRSTTAGWIGGRSCQRAMLNAEC